MHVQTTAESLVLVALGQQIKLLRMNKGISQTELALTCNMEKSSLSKIESGQVNISYLTLMRLSRCLEINAREFCGN